MWQFFTHDGQTDGDAGEDGLREGRPNGYPVDEVVETITEYDHPGHCTDHRVLTLTELQHVVVTFRLWTLWEAVNIVYKGSKLKLTVL